MKRAYHILGILFIFAVLAGGPPRSLAQQFPTVHDHSVIGRIGTGSGSGPSQAIPFVTLVTQLLTGAAFNGQQTTQGLTTTSPGWYAQITGDAFARTRVGLNSTDIPSLAFGPGNVARDTFIERIGAGSLRFGAPAAAAPVAQTLSVQNVVAGTSNTAGATLTINGSQSTGNAAGGSIFFQTSLAGSSGSAQNPSNVSMVVSPTGTVINANATVVGSPVLPIVRPLRVVSVDGQPTEVVLQSFGDDSVVGAFVANGTAASPTAVGSGQVMLHMRSLAWDGTAYGNPTVASSASIATLTTEVQSVGHHGSAIQFIVTPLATATNLEAMRVTSSGGLALGLTANTPLGVVNPLTGYQINSAAPSNHVLVGNGTNYVDTATVPVAGGGTGVTTAAGEMARLQEGFIYASATSVNFNSGNTDTALAIALPTGFTRFVVNRCYISHASGTLTTSTVGVFSATAGGGATIQALTANTVSTASDGTVNNVMLTATGFVGSFVSASLATPNTIYFRVGTAQGTAATGDVTCLIIPAP